MPIRSACFTRIARTSFARADDGALLWCVAWAWTHLPHVTIPVHPTNFVRTVLVVCQHSPSSEKANYNSHHSLFGLKSSEPNFIASPSLFFHRRRRRRRRRRLSVRRPSLLRCSLFVVSCDVDAVDTVHKLYIHNHHNQPNVYAFTDSIYFCTNRLYILCTHVHAWRASTGAADGGGACQESWRSVLATDASGFWRAWGLGAHWWWWSRRRRFEHRGRFTRKWCVERRQESACCAACVRVELRVFEECGRCRSAGIGSGKVWKFEV